ncbi:MAG: ABC transporter ATP-binding protein [Vicinamibacteria bacterium]|nr:ABC transporter ATP-binding protein [Vicinamibacteria bacterium]
MWSIELSRVSKEFVLRHNPAQDLKVQLIRILHPCREKERRERLVALNGVDLRVRRGEFVGVVGSNGSGKSTLLRLLAGIYPPTRGALSVHGRVVPLIELGVGFHPDLNGEENVFLGASLFGLSRRKARGMLSSVMEFSELAPFARMPLKNYSTGMYMRLGFAIAAHLDAEILLLDEVLSVGDEHFRQKCFSWLARTRERDVTILFVSHSLELVEKLCDRAVWLDRGRIAADGEPSSVVAKYRGAS